MARARTRDESFVQHYMRGLGMSAMNNSLAYGFSVMVTSSFGLLDRLRGTPTVGDVFVFAVGACSPFAVLNALVTRGFRERVEREPPVVVSLGTAFGLLSVSASLGVATLLGWSLGGLGAWGVVAATATTAYLALSAFEIALARRVHQAVGDKDPEDR